MQHVMRIVVEEGEAVAFIRELVVGKDGVAQTAGFAGNRHRAIAHGNHLGQTARLELAGHEEHVAAGVDAVRKLMVHRKARRKASRILALRPGEQVGVLRLAHAEHDELDAGRHEFADDALDEIKALLVGQAGDDAHERNGRVDLKTKLLLQLLLADFLAAQMIRIVVGVNLRILRRIIIVDVNAVENADELVLARAEETIQTLAVERGLNFIRIARGNGRQLVRIDQTGLHVVCAAIALQLIGCEQTVAQTEGILNRLNREHALILEVVDGVNGLHILIERILRILNLEQGRNHAGLPVVAVDDIGLEIKMHKRVDDRAVEEAETLVFVAAQTIDVGTAEIILVIDKVEGYALILKALDAAILTAPAQLDLELTFELHLVDILLRDGGIQRQNHADIRTLRLENGGERTDNVGKTAGLNKRYALGSCKKNLHERCVLLLNQVDLSECF